MIDAAANSDSVGGLMKKTFYSCPRHGTPSCGSGCYEARYRRGKRDLEAEENVDLDTIEAERVGELLGYVPGLASVAADSAGYGDILAVRGTANTLFLEGPAWP